MASPVHVRPIGPGGVGSRRLARPAGEGHGSARGQVALPGEVAPGRPRAAGVVGRGLVGAVQGRIGRHPHPVHGERGGRVLGLVEPHVQRNAEAGIRAGVHQGTVHVEGQAVRPPLHAEVVPLAQRHAGGHVDQHAVRAADAGLDDGHLGVAAAARAEVGPLAGRAGVVDEADVAEGAAGVDHGAPLEHRAGAEGGRRLQGRSLVDAVVPLLHVQDAAGDDRRVARRPDRGPGRVQGGRQEEVGERRRQLNLPGGRGAVDLADRRTGEGAGGEVTGAGGRQADQGLVRRHESGQGPRRHDRRPGDDGQETAREQRPKTQAARSTPCASCDHGVFPPYCSSCRKFALLRPSRAQIAMSCRFNRPGPSGGPPSG